MHLFMAGNQTMLTSSDWFFIIGIQVFLLLLFVSMIVFICRKLKAQNPTKSVKKTCVIVWFMSAIAWFIIAQIVWILTYSQFM